MTVDKAKAIAHMDAVLEQSNAIGFRAESDEIFRITARIKSAIKKHAPPDSVYLQDMESAGKAPTDPNYYGLTNDEAMRRQLVGVLQGLRDDHVNDTVQVSHDDVSAFFQLDKILSRFHSIALQLAKRHARRAPFPVADEYDVQDLLHALLLIEFDDVRREDPTPIHAAKYARIDIVLKQHRVAIEVKRTRDSLDEKEIADQLITDFARFKEHPNCNTLICFVYDPERRISNPAGFKNDLESHTSHQFAIKVYVCQH